MVSISIRLLSKRFGSTQALCNVNLDIKAGELFFLLGPSGCGKTTLLRHIAGFYKPDKGTICFDEKDVTNTPPHKRNTAMMFQSYALWPHMTVEKNVRFGLEARKTPKSIISEEVNSALDIVKMIAYKNRKINELSGGQQQRVALARALVVKPKCLLLDEPLSNLDARLRLEMRSEIRRICKEFCFTTVYVTHDQKEALSVADRIAILESGQVAQVGCPQEIYRSPITKSVANFIGETNLIEGIIETHSIGEYWTVTTPLGLFEGRPADLQWSPKKRQKVTLSIRPEALKIDSQDAGTNTFVGRLEKSIYLGEIAQYRLQTRSENLLHIAELNPSQIYQPNQREIFVSVEKNDVVIIRDTSI